MRRWAATALVVAGVGMLALPACGGKTDEAARAAGITPVDAVAFVSVNLAPSIEQKRNLQSIVKKFPDAPKEIQGDFESARDDLLDSISEEVGLDYAKDVKPWLGNEVAVAMLKPAGGGSLFDEEVPPFVLMFETGDAGKATAALKKAADADKFDGQSRVIKGFLVVASNPDEDIETAVLDQVADAAKKGGGLAGDKRFTSVVNDLAGDRLILAWADGRAITEGYEDGTGFPGFPSFGFFPGIPTNGFAAVDLHVEKSALVVRGVSTATGAATGGEPKLTAGLPADALGALTLFDVPAGVRQALRFVAGFGGGNLDDLAEEAGLDIDVEGDLLSWMEGELVVVAGPVPSGGSFPDFALVIEPTDRAKAEVGIGKIAGLVEAQGITLDRRDIGGVSAYVAPDEFEEGIQPAMALFGDRFVMANSVAFLEKLAKNSSPSLGGTGAYESVIGKGSRTGTSFQFLVRLDPIREAIEATLNDEDRADYEREAKANIEPLDSFGMFARRDGDRDRFEMRLTFS